MQSKILEWFGFGGHRHNGHGHGHDHSHESRGHTHGVIDPTIATTARGIWAIKWSFVILAITATMQFLVVIISGSVALLADTIHNVADATTAIPLWIAFILARRKPSATFTYGYGRVEDLAGILIVAIILLSALVAGYQSIDRLLHPQPVTELGWLTAAGLVGFIGNEAVAVLRIHVGREMNSAALVADGYHARTDGLTSLAVVLGAVGVWLGYPLADPIVGLVITVVILGIVWQSARAVLTRMLDGVEPELLAEIEHAAGHAPGVKGVSNVRARWVGHRLHGEMTVAVDPALNVAATRSLASEVQAHASRHLSSLERLVVETVPASGAESLRAQPGHDHPH
jgi:cation diffusion facilitator family transporter